MNIDKVIISAINQAIQRYGSQAAFAAACNLQRSMPGKILKKCSAGESCSINDETYEAIYSKIKRYLPVDELKYYPPSILAQMKCDKVGKVLVYNQDEAPAVNNQHQINEDAGKYKTDSLHRELDLVIHVAELYSDADIALRTWLQDKLRDIRDNAIMKLAKAKRS